MSRCDACPADPAHPCGGVGLYCEWAASGDPNRVLHVRNVCQLKAAPWPPAPPPWASDAPPTPTPLPRVLPEPAAAWRRRIATCLYRDPPGKGCGCQSARCHAGRGLNGLVGDRDCLECLGGGSDGGP